MGNNNESTFVKNQNETVQMIEMFKNMQTNNCKYSISSIFIQFLNLTFFVMRIFRTLKCW